MDLEFALLNIVVLVASALQAATGIGFGVIAGPVLLVVLNDSAAIQISIALNLLIAIILAPALRCSTDRALLRTLCIGVAIGSPLGLLIFLSVDLELLKAIAGIGVLLTMYLSFASNRMPQAPIGRVGRIPVGAVAGAMGACLGMPGPVPAAWMLAKNFGKDAIRATILAMFVFAYAIAVALQIALADIAPETIRTGALLVPSTILGIAAGNYLCKRITEKLFRKILIFVLASTAAILFGTLIWSQ